MGMVPKDLSKNFHRQIRGIGMVAISGPAVENLTLIRRASAQAFRNESLDCFQKSTSAKRKRPAHGFFSDLIS